MNWYLARFLVISFDDRFLCGDVVKGLRLFDRFLIAPVLVDLPRRLSSMPGEAAAPLNLNLKEETDGFMSKDSSSRDTSVCFIFTGGVGCSVC
jgi:hypothetical protein